jgi:DNA-binding transcriptional MerR regulator
MAKERTYSSGEVAKQIRVESVTVRKYAQILEEKGYEFEKDHKGWRRFKEADLNAMKHLATLRHSGMQVEEATETIAGLYRQNLSISVSDTTLQQEEMELQSFMEAQQAFNQKLLERLEFQEKRQAERDQQLMQVLRESQETRKMLAAVKEKKKWWRFWE